MKDFTLPAGTDLSDFFKESGFEYVSKKEAYVANNLYIKIESISMNVSTAIITVSFKKDEFTKLLMLKEYEFNINLNEKSPNIFEQGYEYLKSLEEFSGALSV